MIPGLNTSKPSVRVVSENDVPAIPLGEGGYQRILLGAPRGDESPVLLGITHVAAGYMTALIRHETAEVAYVLVGAGSIVTDDKEYAFGPNAALLIEAHCWHAIRADGEEVTMIFGFPGPSVPPTQQWSV